METQVNHNLQFTDEGLQSVDCRRTPGCFDGNSVVYKIPLVRLFYAHRLSFDNSTENADS